MLGASGLTSGEGDTSIRRVRLGTLSLTFPSPLRSKKRPAQSPLPEGVSGGAKNDLR